MLVALGVALLLWWLPGADTSRLNETTITPAVAAPPPVAVVEPLPEIPEVPATEADPLPSTRAIQGRVISAHGDEPIVGAEISVFVPARIDPSNPRSDLWNRRLGQAISDEEGEFTFSGLEPRGDYSIEVEHRHWLDDSFDINLTAGDLTTDFPLLRGASICGVVVGLGEEDKLFRIRLTGEGYVSSKYKAPGEPFCFEAVPAGELELEITRELANSLEVAYIPVRVDTPFQQISLGTLDLTKGEKVTLRSRCEDEGFVGYSLINLRVLTFDDFNPVYSPSSERPYGVSLLGGLNGPDQFEIRGRLSGLKVQIKATSHSPDYKFSWGEVRPQKGEHLNLTFDCELDPSGLRIENGADLEGTKLLLFESSTPGRGVFARVKVADLAPGEVRDIGIVQFLEHEITIRVVDPDGHPVAGARVGILPSHEEDLDSPIDPNFTDSSGELVIRGVSANIRAVEVSPPKERRRDLELVAVVLDGQSDVVEIALRRALGVTGTIVNAHLLEPGVKVDWFLFRVDEGQIAINDFTDETEWFTNIYSARYRLMVSYPGYWAESDTFDGSATSVNLGLEKVGMISGRIRDLAAGSRFVEVSLYEGNSYPRATFGSPWFSTEATDSGEFEIPCIPGHDLRLVIRRDGRDIKVIFDIENCPSDGLDLGDLSMRQD